MYVLCVRRISWKWRTFCASNLLTPIFFDVTKCSIEESDSNSLIKHNSWLRELEKFGNTAFCQDTSNDLCSDTEQLCVWEWHEAKPKWMLKYSRHSLYFKSKIIFCLSFFVDENFYVGWRFQRLVYVRVCVCICVCVSCYTKSKR